MKTKYCYCRRYCIISHFSKCENLGNCLASTEILSIMPKNVISYFSLMFVKHVFFGLDLSLPSSLSLCVDDLCLADKIPLKREHFNLNSSLSFITFFNSFATRSISCWRTLFCSAMSIVSIEPFRRHFRAYFRFFRIRRRFLNACFFPLERWRIRLFKSWMDIFSSSLSLISTHVLWEKRFRSLYTSLFSIFSSLSSLVAGRVQEALKWGNRWFALTRTCWTQPFRSKFNFFPLMKNSFQRMQRRSRHKQLEPSPFDTVFDTQIPLIICNACPESLWTNRQKAFRGIPLFDRVYLYHVMIFTSNWEKSRENVFFSEICYQ